MRGGAPHPTITGKYWCWAIGSYLGCGEWQEREFELPRDAVSIAWNGEVFPPVGTECEYLEDGNGDWKPIRVVALDEKLRHGVTFIVFHGDNGYSGDSRIELFRPIRTPEQIAAEECDKAVKAMLAEFEHTGSLTSHYEVCEVLHKAGYRKWVLP